MPAFDVISSYGFESNSTTLDFTSGTWNIFTINSSLYIKNNNDLTSTPMIVCEYLNKYIAIKLTGYEIIIIFYVADGVLHKLLVDVEFITNSTISDDVLASDIISIDSVAISTLIRLVYVNSSKLMTILDYTDPYTLTNDQNVELQLSTEDVYQYHIINESDISIIIVYYIDTSLGTTIYENSYQVMPNIVTITPPQGQKTTTFVADLSGVDLDYGNLSIIVSEGTLNVINIDSVGKSITFKLDSLISELKHITVSDTVDTFISPLTYLITNQQPTDIALSSNTIEENQLTGIVIGTLTTTDPDEGDTFTYSLVTGTGDTNNSSFYITGDTLYSNQTFDYEIKSLYSIRVQTKDGSDASFQKVFSVIILNVNEPPSDINLSSNSINEYMPAGTTIGTLTTVDPDVGDTFTYTFSSGIGDEDNAKFIITGNLLKSALPFKYSYRSIYSVRIKSEDHLGLFYKKSFTINIQKITMLNTGNIDSFRLPYPEQYQ